MLGAGSKMLGAGNSICLENVSPPYVFLLRAGPTRPT